MRRIMKMYCLRCGTQLVIDVSWDSHKCPKCDWYINKSDIVKLPVGFMTRGKKL